MASIPLFSQSNIQQSLSVNGTGTAVEASAMLPDSYQHERHRQEPSLAEGENRLRFGLSTLPQGVYLLLVQASGWSGEIKTERVVKFLHLLKMHVDIAAVAIIASEVMRHFKSKRLRDT